MRAQEFLTDLFESREIHNQDRLDQVLARCIKMVHEKNQANPKKYGKVAACIIDMKNRKVFGINLPGPNGTRRHAERMAIDAYHKRYGKILPGAIIVTTLSPCNRPMVERDGASCQDLLLQAGIEKVYSGYMDPSQHSEHPFTEETTKNDDLWRQCKELSDSFVHDDLTESQHDTITADQVLDYVKQAHAPEAFDIEYSITDHPKWELTNIPLSQLNLDPDGEAQDPYNRVNWVDNDKVQDLMPQIEAVLKRMPIVVDPDGWIIDGNHRAMAAAETGLTSIAAYVPVKPHMAENMDHSQDGRAVEELRAALLAKKDQLQSATDDQVYNIIDKIMTRIARSHSISGQKLHDMWVDRYKQIPDTWIMNENFINFMNKSLGTKVDKPQADPLAHAPDFYKNAPVANAHIRPAFLKALKFGLSVLAKLDAETKQELLAGGEQAICAYIDSVAKRTGATGFREEDVYECQDDLANIFHDPTMHSWVDVLQQDINENFADGKGPGRPGDSQRHGIPKKATMAELEKASHAKGRKGQLARWQLNMRRGRKK